MIMELNERIKTYADQNKIPYVDYHSTLKNEQNGMDPDIAKDGVHPTLKAYKIMEGLVQQEIAKVLKAP